MLAAGTFILQWLDYRTMARGHAAELGVALIAGAFLVGGVVLGIALVRPAPTPGEPGNLEAQAALGISAREMEVLRELAAGRSNKEIARRLAVSPNTVKTHIARLFGKLGASRRTEAIARARALKLID